MKKLALIVTLSLIAAACGGTNNAANSIAEQIVEQATGDNVDISTSDDGVTVSFENEDASGSASFSDELPADFPFPVPDEYELGASLTFEDDSGTSYSVVLQVSADDFDAMAEMYESWMKNEGFTVETDALGDGTDKLVFITGERDDASVGATISLEAISNDDAGNFVYAAVITLSWDPKA